MEIKRLLRAFTLSVAACCTLLSCDSDYDLRKKINDDITIGGDELAFPIGTTEKIVVNKLLNMTDEKTIITSENGDYYISMQDSVKPQKYSIPSVTINSTTPIIKPLKFSPITRSRGNLSLTTLSFSLPEPINFSVSSALPKEIISISTAEFAKDETGNYPTLNITIKFSGIPENIPTLTISNITLELPKVMTYVADREVIGTKLIASGEVALLGGAGEYTKTILVKGLDLTNTTIDKSIDIEQQLDIQGTIIIDHELDISLIKGEPSMTFSGAQIKNAQAIIDATIKPIEFIYATDFPEFMRGEGTYLDLLNASIEMNATTNSPAAIEAATEISPYKNGIYIENSKIDFTLNIKPTTHGNDMTTSSFWVSNTNEKAPQSYTWIERNVSSIIRELPETINFIINLQTSRTPAIIELEKEYKIEFDYTLLTPLMLGEKLTINYDKNFTNIQKELKDVIDKISAIIFYMEIDNHVPLGMMINPVPLDTNGNLLTGVDITIDGDVKPAEQDTTNKITGTKGVKSTTKLTIKEVEKGALKNLNSIKMNIKANSNKQIEGAMLNENQFITISMKAKIPNGINLN